MAFNIFIDTNVFLDAILERTAESKDAELIMKMAELKQVEIYTSANNLVNTIYSLRKQKLTSSQIINIIDLTLTYTQLSHTSNGTFREALRAGFSDLEDAVQYFTALSAGNIDYFITSNTKDYKKALAELPVLTPKQFVNLYNRSKSS